MLSLSVERGGSHLSPVGFSQVVARSLVRAKHTPRRTGFRTGASKIALHAAVAAFCVSERTPNNTGEAPRGAINPVPRRGSRENTMSCQPSTSSSMSSSMLRSPVALASLHAIASHVTVSAGHETAAAAPTTRALPSCGPVEGPHGAQRDDVPPPSKTQDWVVSQTIPCRGCFPLALEVTETLANAFLSGEGYVRSKTHRGAPTILDIHRAEFHCKRCVTSRASLGERPQPNQPRLATDDVLGQLRKQGIKQMRGASTPQRIRVVKSEPAHAFTSRLKGIPPSSSLMIRSTTAAKPMAPGTRKRRAP